MKVSEQEAVASAARELGVFLERRKEQIARRWADAPLFRAVFTDSRDEAVEACKAVVDALSEVASAGSPEDIAAPGFDRVREQLGRMSGSRTRTGAGPAQIADEVAALRAPVVELLRAEATDASAPEVAERVLALTLLMGTLRLVMMQTALGSGQELIARQREERLEVATPVISLREGVVVVPLIGTLDSARSQVVMESLLESIADRGARYAVLDITGVSTVDSLVAQHLMKTVDAARLMGAECVVSGIRPAIAQTIVHLGIDLGSVVTRATLADALAYALARQGVDAAPDAGAP
ncbi:STAS domain-containing protein [Streptomyces pilosus]|uniref:STAS domain-containing protein n=1 Tax=Streptomyces pilosus TaxID=28893 RepID=UPI003633427D